MEWTGAISMKRGCDFPFHPRVEFHGSMEWKAPFYRIHMERKCDSMEFMKCDSWCLHACGTESCLWSSVEMLSCTPHSLLAEVIVWDPP